jgi:hypothetical protein
MLYLPIRLTDEIINYSGFAFIFAEFTALVQALPAGTNKTIFPAAQGRRRLPNLRSDCAKPYQYPS